MQTHMKKITSLLENTETQPQKTPIPRDAREYYAAPCQGTTPAQKLNVTLICVLCKNAIISTQVHQEVSANHKTTSNL